MGSKKVRASWIAGLVAVLLGIAVFATTTDITSNRKLRKREGKTALVEKEKINIGITSSTHINRPKDDKYDYVTVQQLTTDPYAQFYPSWSPDGQEIVFQAFDDTSYSAGIWKINVDGTGLTPLAISGYWMCFTRPFYSPDGLKILYQSFRDTVYASNFNAATPFTMDPDGSNKECVIAPEYNGRCRTRPIWSPDGSKIAYRKWTELPGPNWVSDLTILDLASGFETELTEQFPEVSGQSFPDFHKFSPDGSKILFKGARGDEADEGRLCVIGVNGDNLVVIDENSYSKSWDWSPDGKHVVYNSDQDGSAYLNIWIANADGSGNTPILEGGDCYADVDWQPVSERANGNWILYSKTEGGGEYAYKTVWIVTTDGLYTGCLWDVPSQGFYPMNPSWSLQGDKILFCSDCNNPGSPDIYVIDLDTGDNDHDGLMNWEEEAGYGTLTDDPDSDGGDENDGSEIANGRNPFDPGDDVGAAPPYTDGHDPAPDETGVSPETDIVLHVKDDGAGVDESSIVMTVNGATVTPTITGALYDYTITYEPPAPFDSGLAVNVTVDAADLALVPNVMPQDAYSFTITGIGIEEEESLPKEFYLRQNMPNPMYDMTRIRFGIPKATHVSLKIYDTSGRVVRVLNNDYTTPGEYSVQWDGRDGYGNRVASGTYLYELKAGDYKITRKLVVQ